MKYCPNCGNKIGGNEKFCPKCGYQLNSSTETGEKSKSPNKFLKAEVSSPSKKTKPAKNHGTLKKNKYLKWGLGVIIVIILLVVGYRQIYLPNTIKSAIAADSFTSTQGYKSAIVPSKHTIILYADEDAATQFSRELAQNGYDTQKISAENKLGELAHDISSRTIGQWKLAIVVKANKGESVMWEYDGTKEVKRFQTSAIGRQDREEYLEEQKEQQQQAKDSDDAEKVGAGLLGGGIGFLLGSL